MKEKNSFLRTWANIMIANKIAIYRIEDIYHRFNVSQVFNYK